MALSHRSRLTLVSASSAGLLFLIIFGVAAFGLRHSEEEAAETVLAPAASQIAEGIRTAKEEPPDLAEVVQSNPEISLAVFDAKGRLLYHEGKLALPFTHSIGLRDGLMLRSVAVKGRTVVAGLRWDSHEALVHRFVVLTALLWFPLVGFVALATWISARATFLPLERLAQEAEELSIESLSARLHVDDSGEYREFVLRLNRFLEKLEASVQREERFLSDAAHELRTPLTVLRGEIETTLRRSRTSGEYRTTLEVLLDETSRLSSLVELLLRSAAPIQLEAGGIELAECAERAHARWVDRFAAKGVGLELATVHGQAILSAPEFDVIVDNLLANGLRASEPGSECGIAVESSGQVVTLRVWDRGLGVAPEDAERIFERFARVSPGRSRMDGGFGIGLALCKQIVQAHGGRIWVEPNPPKGSNFIVELKAAAN